MVARLSDLRALLIDLDGVIYRGRTLLPGAVEFFGFLKQNGLKFKLVTNNSTRTAAYYAALLSGMGIKIGSEAVFTAGQATAQYLQKAAPSGAAVYVIGEEGLVDPILEAGFRLSEERPQFVVVGLDREVNYRKMATACVAIRAGAKFVAANPDRTLPTPDGFVPGCGAILAAIEACTDVPPFVVGKPETQMLTLVMEQLGVMPEETAIIGDRLDTDILGGQRAGLTTILVLTGVTTPNDLVSSPIQPDHIFADLKALEQQLAAVRAGFK
ncbi:MAG: HAD-IIA family hydrolase [Chloroflexi bacterium]|nr:HAD-IIA family hydrolase [Chloroflexota bacterium]